MKRKIIYTISAVVFILLGIFQFELNNLIYIWDYPLRITGEALRFLSLESVFLNIVSITLYILLSLIPIGILLWLHKNKKDKLFDSILLIVMSVLTFITLYYMINPILLYNNLSDFLLNNSNHEELLQIQRITLIGFSSLLYAVIVLYLGFKVYYSKHLKSLKLFSIILDVIVLILMASVLSIGLSTCITELSNASNNGLDKTLAVFNLVYLITINSISIYLIILFKRIVMEMDSNGIDQILIENTTKLRKTSFLLFTLILGMQFFINAFQFVYLKQISNSSFIFSIPAYALLIAILGFILGNYFKKVQTLKEEDALII